MVATSTTLWLETTDSALNEAGRRRDPLEVYFTLDPEAAAFFPAGHFGVTTDDRRVFTASVTGHGGKETPGKNLRSRPATGFGEWLKTRKHGQVGDWVEVTGLPNGRFFFRYHPAASVPARRGAAAAAAVSTEAATEVSTEAATET